MNPIINPDVAVALYLLPGIVAAIGCLWSYYKIWKKNKDKENKHV